MNFDVHRYKKLTADDASKADYAQAKKDLEAAIATAPISDAVQLKRLRMPEAMLWLELEGLRRAGFNMDLQLYFGEHFEYECLVLAFHARWEWAKKYHPHLAARYDMSDYPLTRPEYTA